MSLFLRPREVERVDADPYASWIGDGFECPFALAHCSASAEFFLWNPVRLEKDSKMWMFENDYINGMEYITRRSLDIHDVHHQNMEISSQTQTGR